jgi:hypothetical protein
VAREFDVFHAHPGLEVGYQWRDACVAHCEALVDGAAVDLALGVEDRVDAFHRLEGERRDHRELAARLGGDVGELEELTSAMRPAMSIGGRSGPPIGFIEPARHFDTDHVSADSVPQQLLAAGGC